MDESEEEEEEPEVETEEESESIVFDLDVHSDHAVKQSKLGLPFFSRSPGQPDRMLLHNVSVAVAVRPSPLELQLLAKAASSDSSSAARKSKRKRRSQRTRTPIRSIRSLKRQSRTLPLARRRKANMNAIALRAKYPWSSESHRRSRVEYRTPVGSVGTKRHRRSRTRTEWPGPRKRNIAKQRHRRSVSVGIDRRRRSATLSEKSPARRLDFGVESPTVRIMCREPLVRKALRSVVPVLEMKQSEWGPFWGQLSESNRSSCRKSVSDIRDWLDSFLTQTEGGKKTDE